MIDAQLAASGWLVQDRGAMNRSAGLGVAVREYPLATGLCDYLLLVAGRACGVVEAKAAGATLSGVAEQARGYQSAPPAALARWSDPLRFDYEASGVELLFSNRLHHTLRASLRSSDLSCDRERCAQNGPWRASGKATSVWIGKRQRPRVVEQAEAC